LGFTFLIKFLPKDNILSLDIPVSGIILSMELVESANRLEY